MRGKQKIDHLFGKKNLERHNFESFVEMFNGDMEAALDTISDAAQKAFENGQISVNSEGQHVGKESVRGPNDTTTIDVNGTKVDIVGGRSLGASGFSIGSASRGRFK